MYKVLKSLMSETRYWLGITALMSGYLLHQTNLDVTKFSTGRFIFSIHQTLSVFYPVIIAILICIFFRKFALQFYKNCVSSTIFMFHGNVVRKTIAFFTLTSTIIVISLQGLVIIYWIEDSKSLIYLAMTKGYNNHINNQISQAVEIGDYKTATELMSQSIEESTSKTEIAQLRSDQIILIDATSRSDKASKIALSAERKWTKTLSVDAVEFHLEALNLNPSNVDSYNALSQFRVTLIEKFKQCPKIVNSCRDDENKALDIYKNCKNFLFGHSTVERLDTLIDSGKSEESADLICRSNNYDSLADFTYSKVSQWHMDEVDNTYNISRRIFYKQE